jgi:60 kDa SS-A/Ro ribonucleoprotein
MTVKFEQHVNRKATPQSEPIPGEAQVKNNAGGYAYEVDKWQRLLRFLILGTDGGTYYVSEKTLTRENAAAVEACLAEDASRTVTTIVEVSIAGRAPKNDQAVFALALAASVQNPDAAGWSSVAIRALALRCLPDVCRIPTHLFHFMAYVKALRGTSRMLRNAIRDWYARWTPDQLAYEMVKYQARDGWSHRDVLRQAHVKLGPDYQSSLRWAVRESTEDGVPVLGARAVARKNRVHGGGNVYPIAGELRPVIAAFEEAKTADTARLIALIAEHRLSHEMLPSAKLKEPAVWDAMLPHLGLTALVRNLGRMTAIGFLKPLSAGAKAVVAKLGDAEALRKARVHPLAILNALRVYQQGRGDKGSLTWRPVNTVIDALDAAFYAAFKNVEPTGKRLLLALDVSGSMSASIAGTGLSCREACAALALVTANVESDYLIVGFTGRGKDFNADGGQRHYGYAGSCEELAISPRKRLDDVVNYLHALPMGSTDCAQPMLYAQHHGLEIDAFAVYTDSETWHGKVHPKQALAAYRQKTGKPAKQVVVGMTATQVTIADPKDPLSLDVVGFDLNTPTAISEFVRG